MCCPINKNRLAPWYVKYTNLLHWITFWTKNGYLCINKAYCPLYFLLISSITIYNYLSFSKCKPDNFFTNKKNVLVDKSRHTWIILQGRFWLLCKIEDISYIFTLYKQRLFFKSNFFQWLNIIVIVWTP